MKNGRISPVVAGVLLALALALALWQFVFRHDNSMSFSTTDLPAAMKTTTPPAQIGGVIPRRSPGGSVTDFTGGARVTGDSAKGPPGRR